jgi:putative ABC transport system permease protein
VALSEVTSTLQDQLGAALDRHGANIVVAPQTEGVETNYGSVAITGVSYEVERLTTADLQAIHSIDYAERLAVVAPVLIGTVEFNGRRATIAGVDFGETEKLRSWWEVAGKLPQAPNQVLVGAEAAEALGLVQSQEAGAAGAPREVADPANAVGKQLTLDGEQFEVAGALAPTASSDDKLIFLALPKAQQLLKRPDELSLVEVSALCVDCPVDMMVRQISYALPNARVTAVRQAVAAKAMTVRRLAQFGAVLVTVVLAVAALLVFVTLTSSMAERRREIGVLRAVGFRRSHILRIVGTETALVSAAGGLLGWLAGNAGASIAVKTIGDAGATVQYDPMLALLSIAGAVTIGALGALWPALRASKLDPTEALRHV